MKFFLDECIPASAIEALQTLGHEAYPITDFVPAGSPDQIVATAAQENKAILVSHDKDFKNIASRRNSGQQTRYKTLSVVRMECKQSRIAERLKASLSIIEREHQDRTSMRDKRLIVNVKSDVITIHR